MPVLSPSDRLKKLRAMTAAEIAERLRYRGLLAAERALYRRGRLRATRTLDSVLQRDLRGPGGRERLRASRAESRRRFFAGTANRAGMASLFAGPYAAEWTRSIAHARRAREHRFDFFGHEFHYGNDIDWQKDPVTGRAWPQSFHADVPVHGGDVGCGDVKHVWELSRQQYLIDLAKVAFVDHSTADLAAMVRLVRSWIAGNPYATGVNWSCALEPAFRVWSWLWAYHLTADQLDPAFESEWLCSLHDHGRFLARHLEYHSSPYNHLIGEASALYALGLLFPEFEASGRWRRLGRGALEDRLSQQFYEDGGSVEQSTFYHHATTGFYLLAALLGRRSGDELSSRTWAAITRALDFSLHLVQPDGRTPEIGGADDGKPIRLEHLPFWDFRPYLAIGAVVFGRADYRAVATRFYEDALWLLGPEGHAAFERLSPRWPDRRSVLLRSSGYFVDRSSWSPDADYLCFDVGEQAAGMRTDAVPNSMHGHADCLSLILWLHGRRVLVDSGLFAYNCGGEWEAHFRETAAHNTARVDGRDQALHLGKMAWSNSYRPAIEAHVDDDVQGWTLASHDGFARGAEGVTHRRAVWRRPAGYVVIHDEFTGAGTHAIELNWQFAPGALTAAGDSGLLYEGECDVRWSGNMAWTVDLRCGGVGAADGWICPSLGVRVPAPRTTLRSGPVALPVALLTVIADTKRCTLRARDGAGGLVVAHDGGTDLVVGIGAEAPDVDTDARVAICSLGADGQVVTAHIGGTYCRPRTAVPPQPGGELACAR